MSDWIMYLENELAKWGRRHAIDSRGYAFCTRRSACGNRLTVYKKSNKDHEQPTCLFYFAVEQGHQQFTLTFHLDPVEEAMIGLLLNSSDFPREEASPLDYRITVPTLDELKIVLDHYAWSQDPGTFQ